MTQSSEHGKSKISRRRYLELTGASALLLGGISPLRAEPEANAPQVYFSPQVNASSLLAIYERLKAPLSEKIGIKIHGGEARVNLELFRALQAHIPDSHFVETNWASSFSGARSQTQSHRQFIVESGVDFAPVDVLDRDGDVFIPIKGGRHLKEIGICKALLEYGGIVVLSNFKIPSFAGYTGCVKNVGIGLVSADAKVVVHGEDYQRTALFFERLSDAAKGVSDAFGKKMIYINMLTDMRPQEGLSAKTGTLGIVGSTDMVAADQAAVDLIYGLQPAQYDAFDMKTKIDRGFYQLETLQRLQAGSRRYHLITI